MPGSSSSRIDLSSSPWLMKGDWPRSILRWTARWLRRCRFHESELPLGVIETIWSWMSSGRVLYSLSRRKRKSSSNCLRSPQLCL